jgi:hypothetical protein
VVLIVVVDLARDPRSTLALGQAELLWTADRWRTLLRDSFWILPLCALVAIKYVTSLGTSFNLHDDQPCYLVQLSRMLQTGTIGADPFSVRQLMSLNGQTFLLALLCSVTPRAYAFLLDPGICWLLVAAQTWAICRHDNNASVRDSCLITALVLLVEVPFINTNGYLCATVLFLTLIRTADLHARVEGTRQLRTLFLLALTAAGLSALKTTYIYFTCLFLASWFSLRLWQCRRSFAILREIASIGIIVFALILPWMLQQYRSAGTPLYPVLGKGTAPSGPGMQPFSDSLPTRVKAAIYSLSQGPNLIPIVTLVVLLSSPVWENRTRWRVLFSSLLSVSLGFVILAFYMGMNPDRYTSSFLFAGMIPIGCWGFLNPRPSRSSVGLAVCLALFVGCRWHNLHTSLAAFSVFARAGEPGTLYRPEDSSRVQAAQHSIPVGKTTLVWIQYAFLLDFSRNPILNLDAIGLASPRPGMPITSDATALLSFLTKKSIRLPPPASPDEVLRYLRAHGIDFLIFERREKQDWYFYTEDQIKDKPYWTRLIQTLRGVGFKELSNLMLATNITYDDGDIVVLDLRPRAQK